LGTFPIGSRSYPRIRPHELAIQIDIIGALLFGQGDLGRWYHEGTKNWQNLVGEDTWPFSGPGERSRGIETGNLQEIAVRTWWDHSRGIKLANLGHDFGADSGPGERSRWIDTGNLQEIAVRTLWDYSRGPKPKNTGQKFKKCRICQI